MKVYTISISLILTCLCGLCQDTLENKFKYYSVNSLGREIGDLTFEGNEFYIQSLHGIKFDKSFGIAAGLTYIHYSSYKFLPLVASIRRSPNKEKPFGYNFDFGYNFPLFGESDDFQLDYKISKGGVYFHPQINGLIYDRKTVIYMNLGYRAYTFYEEYRTNFSFGNQTEVEERTTARFLTIGLTVEI